MAFSVNNRVHVTDQTSQYRGRYGTVKASNSQTTDVRIDGAQIDGSVSLPTKSLQISTQPCPIEYPT